MRTLLIFTAFLFTITGFAQGDFGGGGVKMPSGSGIRSSPVLPSPPMIFGNTGISDKPVKSTFKIGEELPKSIFEKPETFANPNAGKLEELNKKITGDLVNGKNADMVFREVRTNATFARIRYRDHEHPDGDLIRIYCNGVIQKFSVQLESEFQTFELTLVRGGNELEFEALNQGLSGPNTAEFEIVDEEGTLLASHRWNLNTGFRARIVIHRN